MKFKIENQIVDLTEWFEEGRRQQNAAMDRMINEYLKRLKLRTTLNIIDRILKYKM